MSTTRSTDCRRCSDAFFVYLTIQFCLFDFIPQYQQVFSNQISCVLKFSRTSFSCNSMPLSGCSASHGVNTNVLKKKKNSLVQLWLTLNNFLTACLKLTLRYFTNLQGQLLSKAFQCFQPFAPTEALTQQIFTCSRSTIETLEKGVKYFQN